MNREDWLDYFETVNGRKPSEEEIAQALAAGDFSEEATESTSASTSETTSVSASESTADSQAEVVVPEPAQAPQAKDVTATVQGQAAVPPTFVIPQKKKWSLKKILFLVGGIVAVVLIALGVSAGVYYSSGDINGNYHNEAIEKRLTKQWTASQSTDYADVLENVEMALDIKGDKATSTLTITFDYAVYYKQMRSEYGDIIDRYSSLLPSYARSESAFDAYMDEQMESALDDSGASYDADTNTLTYKVFEGNVNRWTRTIDVTWINESIETSSSSNSTSNSVSGLLEDLMDMDTETQVPYSKDGSSVVLSGENDGTFVKE